MMDYTVKIKSDDSSEAVLTINKHLAEKLNLTKKKRGFVSFGTQSCFVDIKIAEDSEVVGESEISLNAGVIADLHIPKHRIFELRIKGNGIIIGPCIGILASHKFEDITKRRLKEIAMNTLAYSRIHGAIIVFSLDKVKKEKRLIEGYCYNSEDDSWEKGVFPYPLSIYRRTSLNERWMNHFLSAIGDTVFSNYSFDKWDMHKWFSVEADLVKYLPETKIYVSKEDITSMLKKNSVVYVKPIWGMKGFGVVKVKKEEENIRFQYREENENKDIIAKTSEEIDNALELLFKSGGHIIQQGLDLITFDGGIVDLRCVMQKNETCKWVCNTIVARIGAKDSVVSNISSGGAAMPGIEFINEAIDLPQAEKYVLREKIVSACTKICNVLDEYGFNFGTLGLDIGIDKNYNIWLIEINNRKPHPAIALRACDIPAYYTILTAPLYYAKALAGFGHKEEHDENI